MPYRSIMVVLAALTLASCSSEEDVTGSISSCAAGLYSAYNPKDMEQCVKVCKVCKHGATTTCTTSCTLRGAH
ncbi:MAG: hypothetical protein HXX15_11575 [Rhodopseudomonas sp.]|uniref:hypothetical protein n=1 Tax=Rhodopseudomonas sp. TaxID=1078 RepID=UPI00181DFEED|nr:hypothetical protein [Rhodopseudomonas sp.]NVN86714.1 hypothetical protein [Rhodopseudomonas sp.]